MKLSGLFYQVPINQLALQPLTISSASMPLIPVSYKPISQLRLVS